MAEINAEIHKVDQSEVSTGQAPETEPGGVPLVDESQPVTGPSDPPSPHQDAAPAVEARVDTPLDLAARTLAGDLRDNILELFRDQREPWRKLGEAQQGYVAQRVFDHCDRLVREAVGIIAAHDFPATTATLKEAKVKDGIEAKIVLSRYDDNRHALMDAAGSTVLILLADADAFLHARGAAKIDRARPALPLEAAEPVGDAIGPVEVGEEVEIAAAPAEPVEPDVPDASDTSEAARQYFRDLGKEAALRGEPAKNNPYRHHMRARRSWAEGHKAGQDAAAVLAASDAAATAPNGEAVA